MTLLCCRSLVILALLLSTTARGETLDKVLATVDGDPITTYEIDQFLAQRTQGQALPEGFRPDSPQVLEAFITEKLIQKEVSDQGIVVTEDDVKREIERIRAANKISPERMKQAVEAQGMSWDQYQLQVREEIQKMQLINREIRGKVNVTPEEIQRYYEKHKSEFVTAGSQVRVRHLLLPIPPTASEDEAKAVVARADELRNQIDDADDFARVAKEAADDDEGGDLGYLDPESMQEDLGTAVKKLGEGEVSEPIVSSAGVHLVMVEDVKEGSEAPVNEFSEQIKQKLYKEAIEERYERWLREDLRLRHYVDIRP